MKRRLPVIILIILVASAMSLAGWAYAQEPDSTSTPLFSIVLGEDVVLRGGPSVNYPPVGQLQAGDFLFPVSRSEDGNWILVSYFRGSFGWIRRDLGFWVEDLDALSVVFESALTPTTEAGRETATPFFPTDTPDGNWVESASDVAYVRAGPGAGYLRLGQLPNGATVVPVARNAETNWVMIRWIPQVLPGATPRADEFAWIASNLVDWEAELSSLPVIGLENLTPTATFTNTATATVTWTATATDTATATHTPTVTATATATSTFTPTATSTATDTVTPSPTVTPSLTSSPTATLTHTPTETATDIPTLTVTPLPTHTVTATSTLTATSTETATVTSTPTLEPSETATPTLTATSTETATVTSTPTLEPSETATQTVIPTETATNTETATETATATLTETVIPTETATDTPTATHTAVPTETATNTLTATPTVTETVIPTETATDTPTATATLTDTPPPTATLTETQAPTVTDTDVPLTSTGTQIAAQALVVTQGGEPTATRTLAPRDETGLLPSALPASETPNVVAVVPSPGLGEAPPVGVIPPVSGNRLPLELIVGGLVVAIIATYGGLFLRAALVADRYAAGYVIDKCPVCKVGNLSVDSRTTRILGIPRSRRTVRCDNCRSVLREVGFRRWRYAIDRLANPELYSRYNGRVMDDAAIARLASGDDAQPPAFVDDDGT